MGKRRERGNKNKKCFLCIQQVCRAREVDEGTQADRP